VYAALSCLRYTDKGYVDINIHTDTGINPKSLEFSYFTAGTGGTSLCGLKLLGYEALNPSVCGLKLQVYAAFSSWCMRPEATSVCGLKLLVYAALTH
jgi:hypothetical protein